MLIPIGKQIVQQYRDTRDAFAERMPEHVADFHGVETSPGWVPAFLSLHLPGIDWASIPIHETPDLIRNYPKGAEEVSEAWRPTKYADYDKRPNRAPYSVIKP